MVDDRGPWRKIELRDRDQNGCLGTRTDSKPLLAFAVMEDCESTGGIIFAHRAIVARRKGANEFNGGEFEGVSCRRAPWADEYAPGPVPPLVMIDHGWWFPCWDCNRIISQNEMDDDEEDHYHPVAGRRAIWCNPTCRSRWIGMKYFVKEFEIVAVENMRASLLRRLPGVEIVENEPYVYVNSIDGLYTAIAGRIGFLFPGCTIGLATWGFDREEVLSVRVCTGDLKAWEVWRANQANSSGCG